MKKILIYLFIFVLVLSFAGCGAKDKLEQKIGEGITEKILEESSDGKVDIDDGTITFEGEDGETVVIGGTKWPTSDLAKNVPKFEKGNIISTMESSESLTIALEAVKKEDFLKYLEKIKADYTEEAFESNSEGNITYAGGNGQGIVVFMNYVEGQASISVTKESY